MAQRKFVARKEGVYLRDITTKPEGGTIPVLCEKEEDARRFTRVDADFAGSWLKRWGFVVEPVIEVNIFAPRPQDPPEPWQDQFPGSDIIDRIMGQAKTPIQENSPSELPPARTLKDIAERMRGEDGETVEIPSL